MLILHHSTYRLQRVSNKKKERVINEDERQKARENGRKGITKENIKRQKQGKRNGKLKE
jgi:hypothetical protein